MRWAVVGVARSVGGCVTGSKACRLRRFRAPIAWSRMAGSGVCGEGPRGGSVVQGRSGSRVEGGGQQLSRGR